MCQLALKSDIPNVTQYVHPADIQCNAAREINNLNSSHNLKTYTALSQIGITAGEETIESIFDTMSDNSMLSYLVWDSANYDIYPTVDASVIFYKINHTRSFAICLHSSKASFWVGTYYHPTGTEAIWTGWNPAGIPCGSDEPSLSNMQEGALYFQYEA